MLYVWLKPLADNSLAPVSGFDRALIEKLPRDGKVLAKISQPRSLKHHRKLMGTLWNAFGQQEAFDSFDRFRAHVVVRAGFKKSLELPSGAVTPETLAALIQFFGEHVFAEPMESGFGVRFTAPTSLQFELMDQKEFELLYPRALDVLATEFGFDVEELQREPA